MNRFHVFGAIGIAMVVLVLGMLDNSAQAQSDVTPPQAARNQDLFYMRVGPGPAPSDDAIGFVGFEEGLGGKTVTGAPYSATISTQTTQALADGNRIDRTTTGLIARDSQGRTRRDITLLAIGEWANSGQKASHVVIINDSVAGAQYILRPDRKTARKMQWMHHGKQGDRMPRGAEIISRPGSGAGDDGNATTTTLGSQTINGVQAEGTRVTHTIPAGAIGNANPIVITSERWYSPELQTVILTKHSDPRMGETTFQLTNIQKEEPDPTLFQVPLDYTVREGRQKYFRRRAVPAPPAGDAQP
jgi:hypothetical protein